MSNDICVMLEGELGKTKDSKSITRSSICTVLKLTDITLSQSLRFVSCRINKGNRNPLGSADLLTDNDYKLSLAIQNRLS